MDEIHIELEGIKIVLWQSSFEPPGTNKIEIFPDQVDILIEWLKEAKDKLEKEES